MFLFCCASDGSAPSKPKAHVRISPIPLKLLAIIFFPFMATPSRTNFRNSPPELVRKVAKIRIFFMSGSKIYRLGSVYGQKDRRPLRHETNTRHVRNVVFRVPPPYDRVRKRLPGIYRLAQGSSNQDLI